MPTQDPLDQGGPVIYTPGGPQGNTEEAVYSKPDKSKKKKKGKKYENGDREDSPMPTGPLLSGGIPVMMSAGGKPAPGNTGPGPIPAKRPDGFSTPVDSPSKPLKGILKTPTESPVNPRKGILKTPTDSPRGTPPRRPSLEGHLAPNGPPRMSQPMVPLPHMGIPPPVAPKPSPRPKSMEGIVDKDSPKPSPRPRRPSLEGGIDKPTPRPRPPSRGDDIDDFRKKSMESLV